MNTKSTPKPSRRFWKSWLAGSLLLLGSARADSLGGTAPKIRAVVIDRQSVFSREQEDFWLFRWANRLHMRTKEAVVQRELLLQPEETYDSSLAKETERNLRSLGLFGSVSVTSHYVSDSAVDLLVETTDQWSTEGTFSFGGGGGAYEFSLGLEEKNLLGWGQQLELLYEESDLQVGRRGSLYERRIFSKPVSLWVVGESRSDGEYYSVEAGRPLYSSKDRWGANVRLFSFSGPLRFFDAGEELFSFRQTTREAGMSLLRSWGRSFKTNVNVGYLITQNRFEAKLADVADARIRYGYILPEERVHAFSTGVTWYANRYWEESHLDNFGIVEDVRRGETFSLEYVLAPKFLGSSLTRQELALSVGTTCKAGRHFLRFSAGNRTTFLPDGWEGTFWQGGVRYYWRWGTHQTAALRFDLSAINGLSRFGQFLLGGESGLRGYEARSFSGSRMVLGTMEQRIFGPRFFSLFGLGGALFADLGEAWKTGEDFRSGKLKSNWGIGLRVGLLRSSQFKVLRFDWARPFGRGDWVFSFGTGMSFKLE
ncbi:MAG: BamA/TamA family outer membrane protein [candidate division Zixibacteria bacterium]|nr:BamA/TamA family outer membrane protein [candidate division Zixibacteria bacterium]